MDFFLSQFLEPRSPADFGLPWRLLLDQDPRQVAQDMVHRGLLEDTQGLLRCTAAGRQQAQQYLDDQQERRLSVRKEVVQAFQDQQWERACQVYLDFESHQPFPNDRALNPTESSRQHLSQELQALARLPAHWQEKALLGWLWSSDSDDPELECLLQEVSNQLDLQRYQQEGIDAVQLLLADAEQACAHCQPLHEQAFSIQQIPGPCPGQPPCRRVYLPYFE